MSRGRYIFIRRILLAALIAGFGSAHIFALYKLGAGQQPVYPVSASIALNND
jgi:hypothetical protein